MANPSYIQKHLTMKPEVTKIFESLEAFREFCCDTGLVFNEADLNNFKSYSWQQYQKFTSGKFVKNHWNEAIAGTSFSKTTERKQVRS